MALFEKAFQKTMGHEGGYSFDPTDLGGETYRGIARRYHPSWDGWDIIDEVKKTTDPNSNTFERIMAGNSDLQESVKKLYKQLYWDRFWGDRISSQVIANELFDTGVNMGVGRAVEFLQASINLISKNQIAEDGAFGPRTLESLAEILSFGNEDSIAILLNIHQGNHYVNFMLRKPAQKKFAAGWIRRVELHISNLSSHDIRADLLHIDYRIAQIVCDLTVKVSEDFANRSLQGALNLLNRNRPDVYWPEITVDGIIGSQTLSTIEKCVSKKSSTSLEKMLCILLGRYVVKTCLEGSESDIVSGIDSFFRG